MKKYLSRYARFGFGLLALIAIFTEMFVTMAEGSFVFFSFFGFFTILSNMAASILLIYLGIKGFVPERLQVLRGAITLYMLMTGVIFLLLLSGLEGVRLTAVPWDNIVLHYIMPIVVVADWFVFPPKKRISKNAIYLWLIFPIAYVIYSLIRGSFIGWYPYPFLNPSSSSYAQVFMTSIVLAVFVASAAFVIKQRSLAGKHTQKH